jgi:cytochrome b pre-mRNA-processing protein 3
MAFLHAFGRPRHETAVRAVYEAIVAAARHPRLYAGYGVPDTLDGRYDMIVLHAVLALQRLKSAGSERSQFSQRLTDYLFADMDRSLRELGVGDLSVGKKVRRMAEVFYGRARAYVPGLEARSRDLLAAALARNVFPDGAELGDAERLADYALSAHERLRQIATGRIIAGHIDFGEPGA